MVKIVYADRIPRALKCGLMLLLFAPVLCFSQQKKGISLQAGGGYLFYPGSSADVKIPADHPGNPLKSGFSIEAVATRQINPFLHLGLGASFNSMTHLGAPYIPVFADIRVVGPGRFKLFSFLDPGYGFFRHDYQLPAVPLSGKLSGGFYIGYGFGVLYRIWYLQAKYNWFRFGDTPGEPAAEKTSKAYGVGGITVGVRLP